MMFLPSHSQEAEGGVKWNWAWPSLVGGTTVVSSQNAVQHHLPTPAGRDDIEPCFCLSFNLLLVFRPPLGSHQEGLWETWLDFRGRDYLGRSRLARGFQCAKRGCVLEKKNSIFKFLFFRISWFGMCIASSQLLLIIGIFPCLIS